MQRHRSTRRKQKLLRSWMVARNLQLLRRWVYEKSDQRISLPGRKEAYSRSDNREDIKHFANKKLQTGACERKTDHNAPVMYQNKEFLVWKSATVKNRMKITHKWMEDPFTQYCEKPC